MSRGQREVAPLREAVDLSKLIDEAKALSRPSLEYFPGEPADAAAWCFGVAPEGDAVGVRGDDGDWLIVGLNRRWEATQRLSGELPGGEVPLAAAGTSFPSASALFVFGSEDLKSWLRANGWDPEWGYNENFAEAALIEEYEQRRQARDFVVDTTRVRDPRAKGRVERSVRHVRDDCFAGENISDIEGLRRGPSARRDRGARRCWQDRPRAGSRSRRVPSRLLRVPHEKDPR